MNTPEYEAAMAAVLSLAMACKVTLGLDPKEFTARLLGAAQMFEQLGKTDAAALLRTYARQLEKAHLMEGLGGQGTN